MQHFGPPLTTHTFDWPQFWFIRYVFPPLKPVMVLNYTVTMHAHNVSTSTGVLLPAVWSANIASSRGEY